MNSSIAYLFAIIVVVIALNFYLLVLRPRNRKKTKKMGRAAVDEAKQALWREKEVARRIEREQDDAIEIVKLRNETLAMYEEVRRRHANDDELARLAANPNLIDDRPVQPERTTAESEPGHIKRGTDDPANDRISIDVDPFDIPHNDDRR